MWWCLRDARRGHRMPGEEGGDEGDGGGGGGGGLERVDVGVPRGAKMRKAASHWKAQHGKVKEQLDAAVAAAAEAPASSAMDTESSAASSKRDAEASAALEAAQARISELESSAQALEALSAKRPMFGLKTTDTLSTASAITRAYCRMGKRIVDARPAVARGVDQHFDTGNSVESARLVLGPRVVTVHETKHLIVCPASIVWGCLVIATGS